MKRRLVKKHEGMTFKKFIEESKGASELLTGDIKLIPGEKLGLMTREPSLNKLLLKGRINQEEYNALCTGNRNDILLAFNLELFNDNDECVRSILIKKAIEDGE